MKTLAKIIKYVLVVEFSVGTIVAVVNAGSVTPPSTITAQGHTLTDLYNKVLNINSNPGSHTLPTATTPNQSFVSLSDIYQKLNEAKTSLVPGNIKSGVKIMGVTGSYTGSSATAGLTTTDPLLVSKNIKAGVTIAGVTGNYVAPTTVQPVTWAPFSPNKAYCYSYALVGRSQGYPCNYDMYYPGRKGAVEICASLNEAGTATTSQVLGIWRLPTLQEYMNILDTSLTTTPPTTVPGPWRDSIWLNTPAPNSEEYKSYTDGRYFELIYGARTSGHTGVKEKGAMGYVRCVK